MNPTASSLERAIECPASAVLPRVYERTEDSARGDSIHRFVRRVVRGIAIDEALSHVAEKWRATCLAIDWQAIASGLTSIASERAFAIDAETHETRFLGEDIGRRYPALRPTEFAGTEDIGALGRDGLVVTADVKTGQPVTACADNAQIKFHAARASLAYGVDEVDGRVVYIREDGAVHVDRHVFTRIEIEDFLDTLAELVGRLDAARRQYAETGTATTSPGPWCRYCPAVSACPSKVALARAMAGDTWTIAGEIKAMTPEQKGVAWAKAKEIETILEVVLDGLKDCARQEEFPTRGGEKRVKEIEINRTDFVAAKALELLQQLGATRVQIDSLYVARTISQVREVNAPKLPAAKKRGKAA